MPSISLPDSARNNTNRRTILMSHPRLRALAATLRNHTALVRRQARGDAGYTTETIVVTALLVVLALTVVGIIVAKVLAKAHSIDLG